MHICVPTVLLVRTVNAISLLGANGMNADHLHSNVLFYLDINCSRDR